MQCICVGGAQGSQIFKWNSIILIRSKVIVILQIWVSSALGVGQVGGGCRGWSAIVYMSSGMFRGKGSSNRIELSWLVQDLLNFGGLGSLQLWGWLGLWMGMGGGGGCTPHMCTCMHTHACMVNMIISCKWLLPLDFWGIPGNFLWCHTQTCACMHVHVHVCGGTLSRPTSHIHPPPPPNGEYLGISQNSIVLELIEIFQFCLKIWNLWRLPHPWLGV